ncbi:MAG: tetratricopeptide repeat protein [Desulfovibrio sp.]|jgi:tetratricopeptide (TPR) repeat protein|nr:tetratricopeptide repeat protein [Desulfovibrio sp.]
MDTLTLPHPLRSGGLVRRWLPCLTLAATLVLAGCSGCSGPRKEKAGGQDTPMLASAAELPDATASEPGGEAVLAETVTPLAIDVKPTPEAEITYSYLCAIRAIQHDDEQGLLEAMNGLKSTEVPPEVWLEGGVWLMGRKSLAAAAYLEEALRLWPENLSLTLLYTEFLAEHNLPDRAIQTMQDYLQRHPDIVEAKMEMALLLVKSKRYADADALFAGLSQQQRTPMVEYYHARALIGMHRQADALPHLQMAVKGMPDFVEALAELAFLYEQMNNMREARNVYEKLHNMDFAPREVTLRLISCSLRLNQPDRALRYMRQGPEDPQFKLAAVHLFLGAKCYLIAEGLLKQMVEAGSQNPDVFMLLAELAYEHGRDVDRAISWLDRIPPKSSVAPKVSMMRAELLANNGRDKDALEVLSNARVRFPEMAEFADMQIRLLARGKQMDAALSTARQAQKIWPANTDLSFLLGSLLDEMGDKKGAYAVMEGILQTQPENYQALNYVGYTLAEENRDLERALSLLIKADSISPNQSYIVDSLAWTLFKMGRNDEALAQIRRAVTLSDKVDAAIWEHYGDIALVKGLKEEARKAYMKALESRPVNADALRQRLSKL